MKKKYPLSMCKELHSKVEELAKEDDRSINYMLCKLIEKGFENNKSDNSSAIYLNNKTIKDIEKIANKCNKTKEEVLESMIEAYKSTFK